MPPTPGAGRRLPDRRQGVTLADVARLAEVSEITVSRILRNHGPAAPATRDRVLAAVREVGYVPNRLAGGLASSGSKLVGVIVPSLTNIVFPEVLGGIRAALDGSGFQAVIGVSDYDLAVGHSHWQAGFDTGHYLLGRGYRRFGYVGHDWIADHRARLRYDGLVAALAGAGLTLLASRRCTGASSTAAGRDQLANLLEGHSDLDVVVFSNDDMATGGVFHCLAAGIAPRSDLALFGFNGLDIGQALPTPLSTMRSNRFETGRTAVEHLLRQRERPAAPAIIDTGYQILPGATA